VSTQDKEQRRAEQREQVERAVRELLTSDGWRRRDPGDVPRLQFDISQTDGESLPEVPREPITGDSHEHYLEPLKALARSMDLTVYEYEPTSEAQGFYDEKGKRIVISTDLAPNGKVRTLIHELAHAHGVTYKEYTRGEAEVIVETAATIVCGSLGLDTSGESIPYIAGWGENGDLAAIKKHAETVDTIARSIETACGLGGRS
jgi:hypothetical protein